MTRHYSRRLCSWAVLFLVLRSSAVLATPHAGLAATKTPPMGWNSWNAFNKQVSNLWEGGGFTTAKYGIRDQAFQMSTNGMAAAGYIYVNLDSGWASSRDANGNIVVDPVKFPSSVNGGLKPLADYIHSLGLKIGIYTDRGSVFCDEVKPGTKTYIPGLGALNHEIQDAQTFASWGIDYVKEDTCFGSSDLNYPNGQANQTSAQSAWGAFANLIQSNGRPMVFAIADPGKWNVWSWGPTIGNLWRTTGDAGPGWKSVIDNFEGNAAFAPMADIGTWNDPDLLEIGNASPGPTEAIEAQSQMNLWAISAAPLIVSTDLTSQFHTLQQSDLDILLNKEVIAIDQDSAGVQGALVAVSPVDPNLEVYSKILADGARAVLLLNRHDTGSNDITVDWKDIGLAPAAVTVRNVVSHQIVSGSHVSSYTAPKVPAHGSVLLKIGAPAILATLPFNATSFASEEV